MLFNTKCVKSKCKESFANADRVPIFQNNLYQASDNLFYSRYGNINATELANQLLNMYDRPNLSCYLTSSGMSAISVLVSELFRLYKNKGKNEIVLPLDLYEETKEYFKYVDSCLKVKYIDLHDLSKLAEALSKNTLLVFLDSLTNPMYEDYDIFAISRMVHKYQYAKVVVDNTLLTSYYCNPFKLGADIVVESLGKYTCGFGDVMAGVIIGLDVKKNLALQGSMVSPFSCWLLQRSIPTLPIRMDRVTSSASRVVEYLKSKTPNVRWYGKGGLITFSFDDSRLHPKIIKNCKMIFNGYAFGYEETLILQNYAGYCLMKPPYESHLRVSVGLEAPEDIINDLDQAITIALNEV